MDEDKRSLVRKEPVLIVGAGPAGRATAAMLQHVGIASRILEAGPEVGYSWSRHYDQLHLHTGRRISGLPGYPLPRGYPVFVPRAAFLQYLRAYARRFNLTISTGQRVERAEHTDSGWHVYTADAVWEAPVLVAASGIAAHPHTPPIPGIDTYRGKLVHSSEYHNAAPFAGQRVLVVGMGNSGAEIARDLTPKAAQVTLSVRSGIAMVPRRLFGVPMSDWAVPLSYLPPRAIRVVRTALSWNRMRLMRRLGLPVGPADEFPVIGLEILDLIRAGRVRVARGVKRFTPDGVEFADGKQEAFDAVVLATGFRAALEYLAPYIAIPEAKKPQLDIQAAPQVPNLYFVGLYYHDLLGSLFLIRRQAREVAYRIKRSGAAHVSDAWVEAGSAQG
jgi:cation diffusion facilitator CzcD-associated flavoprotein CzcO